ncbi:YopX family protein [Lactiplantibacillus plantarum]|uniref:YopX family protein n=1 Tax=Lactiplantibacillus plantarum TaxID=1590 RepID=UPI0028FC2EE8|nr:YopX family protein [Lactiplantibacillus plantarum]WNW16710.1 YopX family protein [Lactiplantibacillus plantarum]WNW19684.1 YopX family protein [Lactiplantibacillus plantarum]
MIKFRAWDKTTSSYRKVLGIEFYPDGQIKKVKVGGLQRKATITPDQLVLEQFTGLKDVNGKEIYEGDILENRKYRSIVKFASGKFLADLIETIQTFDLIGETHGSKVIGNVHENPELLEAGK